MSTTQVTQAFQDVFSTLADALAQKNINSKDEYLRQINQPMYFRGARKGWGMMTPLCRVMIDYFMIAEEVEELFYFVLAQENVVSDARSVRECVRIGNTQVLEELLKRYDKDTIDGIVNVRPEMLEVIVGFGCTLTLKFNDVRGQSIQIYPIEYFMIYYAAMGELTAAEIGKISCMLIEYGDDRPPRMDIVKDLLRVFGTRFVRGKNVNAERLQEIYDVVSV